jgi:RNA polymerase sigma-70 factor (ECF subfamily)
MSIVVLVWLRPSKAEASGAILQIPDRHSRSPRKKSGNKIADASVYAPTHSGRTGALDRWHRSIMLGFIDMQESEHRTARFERLVLPHLDAAYNLARWLTRDAHQAQDIVQDACVRALRFLDSCKGNDGRAWLLAIVRNTFFSAWRKRPQEQPYPELDEDSALWSANPEAWKLDPAAEFSRKSERERVDRALLRLPVEYREIVILRELEDLSYREIAEVLSVPVGTVMSRLSRARSLLARHLRPEGGG